MENKALKKKEPSNHCLQAFVFLTINLNKLAVKSPTNIDFYPQ